MPVSLDRSFRHVYFVYIRRCTMRTNIVLDDTLVQEALKLSGAKTKREIISLVLKKFVGNRRRRNLLDLAGKIQFRENYDYKTLREGK
jgi:Arc/MetJ family transcription regulator